jgi:hypothetical protein
MYQSADKKQLLPPTPSVFPCAVVHFGERPSINIPKPENMFAFGLGLASQPF